MVALDEMSGDREYIETQEDSSFGYHEGSVVHLLEIHLIVVEK